MRRALIIIAVVLVVGLLILQLAQFLMPGFPPDNPPVTNTVNWNSQQTATLWDNACADCHSNQTDWPVYSYVAPMSFLVVSHVNNGREELNVSTGGEIEAEEMVEVIREGQLDDIERDQLISGIQATFGTATESDSIEGGQEFEEEEEEGEQE